MRAGGLDGCGDGVDTAGDWSDGAVDGGHATEAGRVWGIVTLENTGSRGGDGVDAGLDEGSGDTGLLRIVVWMATTVAALRVWFGIYENGKKEDGE